MFGPWMVFCVVCRFHSRCLSCRSLRLSPAIAMVTVATKNPAVMNASGMVACCDSCANMNPPIGTPDHASMYAVASNPRFSSRTEVCMATKPIEACMTWKIPNVSAKTNSK